MEDTTQYIAKGAFKKRGILQQRGVVEKAYDACNQKKLQIKKSYLKPAKQNDSFVKQTVLDGYKMLEGCGVSHPKDAIRASFNNHTPPLNEVIYQHMSEFTKLLFLDVSCNNLPFARLSRLPALVTLCMPCNNVVDFTLPFVDESADKSATLTFLDPFPSLAVLDLTCNNLSINSVRQLSQLPMLHTLLLDSNGLTGLPADMSSFFRLTKLSLRNNKLGSYKKQRKGASHQNNSNNADNNSSSSGNGGVGGVSNEGSEAGRNPRAQFAEDDLIMRSLSSLPRLDTLDLSGNLIQSVSMDFEPLNATEQGGEQKTIFFSHLKVLLLTDNHIAETAEITDLSACPELAHVDIRGTPLGRSFDNIRRLPFPKNQEAIASYRVLQYCLSNKKVAVMYSNTVPKVKRMRNDVTNVMLPSFYDDKEEDDPEDGKQKFLESGASVKLPPLTAVPSFGPSLSPEAARVSERLNLSSLATDAFEEEEKAEQQQSKLDLLSLPHRKMRALQISPHQLLAAHPEQQGAAQNDKVMGRSHDASKSSRALSLAVTFSRLSARHMNLRATLINTSTVLIPKRFVKETVASKKNDQHIKGGTKNMSSTEKRWNFSVHKNNRQESAGQGFKPYKATEKVAAVYAQMESLLAVIDQPGGVKKKSSHSTVSVPEGCQQIAGTSGATGAACSSNSSSPSKFCCGKHQARSPIREWDQQVARVRNRRLAKKDNAEVMFLLQTVNSALAATVAYTPPDDPIVLNPSNPNGE